KAQTHDADHRSRPLERKHGKKVLGEIVDDAEGSLCPVEGNQVFPKNIALDEARVLDNLAQFHVVDYFHAQSEIRADRLIHRAPDHVESTHTHVVARLGIGNLPRTVSENEKRLE